jgi:hypothetical protein
VDDVVLEVALAFVPDAFTVPPLKTGLNVFNDDGM